MGVPPCRSRKRPSPPEGSGPDVGPLRALHLKHTFHPAYHRKVSTDMLAIGFSPCLSKKRPSQGPNGQALRNMDEKIVQAGRTSGLACWPAKPNRTARKAIKDEHKKGAARMSTLRASDGPRRLFYLYKRQINLCARTARSPHPPQSSLS